MPDPSPAVTRFKEAHTPRGGGGRVVILPDTVHTAVLAAEALGCEVGRSPTACSSTPTARPVLILTSGAHRVDTAATAARDRRTGAEAGHAGVRPRSTPAR